VRVGGHNARMTMTSAERAHTKQRLAERYGLDASSAEIFQMAKRIAHGHARFIERQSRDIGRWHLDHRGQVLRLVFDSRRRSILTALPPQDSAAYLSAKARAAGDGACHGATP
jgi:hypothetical protein